MRQIKTVESVYSSLGLFFFFFFCNIVQDIARAVKYVYDVACSAMLQFLFFVYCFCFVLFWIACFHYPVFKLALQAVFVKCLDYSLLRDFPILGNRSSSYGFETGNVNISSLIDQQVTIFIQGNIAIGSRSPVDMF